MRKPARAVQVSCSDLLVLVDEPSEAIALDDHFCRPSGLTAGKYTFRVMVDDREVRSKEFTVQ